MKLARKIAVLLALLACLSVAHEPSRAQCDDECVECQMNAEGFYYYCLNQCSLAGHGPLCQYNCNRNYQQQLESCNSL